MLTTFINSGYEIYDIWYQNPVFFQDILYGAHDQLVVDDAMPTSEKLKLGIMSWESTEENYNYEAWENSLRANTGPLYIYLIGHGAEDCFQIMPNEVITAKELKESLFLILFKSELN